jgi:hypothetical protein
VVTQCYTSLFPSPPTCSFSTPRSTGRQRCPRRWPQSRTRRVWALRTSASATRTPAGLDPHRRTRHPRARADRAAQSGRRRCPGHLLVSGLVHNNLLRRPTAPAGAPARPRHDAAFQQSRARPSLRAGARGHRHNHRRWRTRCAHHRCRTGQERITGRVLVPRRGRARDAPRWSSLTACPPSAPPTASSSSTMGVSPRSAPTGNCSLPKALTSACWPRSSTLDSLKRRGAMSSCYSMS